MDMQKITMLNKERYSFNDLIGLLDKIISDAFMILLSVPRAALFATKDDHHVNKVVKGISFFSDQFGDFVLNIHFSKFLFLI